MKDLHYTFTCTASPVQAEGTVAGRAFYFRARHEHWTFAVSEASEVDPVDVEASSPRAFFVEAQYGQTRFAASFMPLDEAALLIERCNDQYLRTRREGTG